MYDRKKNVPRNLLRPYKPLLFGHVYCLYVCVFVCRCVSVQVLQALVGACVQCVCTREYVLDNDGEHMYVRLGTCECVHLQGYTS